MESIDSCLAGYRVEGVLQGTEGTSQGRWAVHTAAVAGDCTCTLHFRHFYSEAPRTDMESHELYH